MDNFFRRQESDTQHPGGISTGLQIFRSILNWLIGLIKLTEDEQKDAGVYFKDGRNN
jgi:hypothetical protein